MKRVLPLFAFIILCQYAKAQQGFGTSTPAPSTVIDMVSGTKGVLMPRVALTSTTVAAPVVAPADALTVFNTNTAGDVTPGYYYWSAIPAPGKWVRLSTANDIQEPWYNIATLAGATANTQSIYQLGQVGINTATPVGQLHVVNPTYALQSVFERTNTGLMSGIAAGTAQFLYNTLTSPLAGYTGSGVGKGAPYNGMSVGFNFAFKSNNAGETLPRDIAAINAGLVDYGVSATTAKGQLNFIVNGSGTTLPSMVLASNGYLGIGTVTTLTPNTPPSNPIHVKATTDPVRFEGLQPSALSTDVVVMATTTGVLKTATTSSLVVEPWFVQGGTLQSKLNADDIYHTGSVAIGIASGASIPAAEVTAHNPKLYIDGNVSATGSFYTTSSVYADYVFEKYFNGSSKIDDNYQFKSLNEVEVFIKANKHLPGVTPIAEVNKTKNGYSIDMTKLSVQSLEKIEELYLHTIEMNTKMIQKDQEIKSLQEKTKSLEERLSRLELLIDKK